MLGTITNATTWYIAELPQEVPPATEGIEDIDPRFWYLDRDTGDLYQQEDDGWKNVGATLPPGSVPPGDGLPPPKVTGLVVLPVQLQHPDGTALPSLDCQWDDMLPVAPDITQYEVQTIRTGNAWASPVVRFVGSDEQTLVLDNLVGGISFDVRVRAHDVDGYAGPWSDVVAEVAPPDSVPPDVMEPPDLNPGYRLLAVRWAPASDSVLDSPAIDIDFYEVRIARDEVLPEDVQWSLPMQAAGTFIVINDLDYDTVWNVQVRAVDRSGNVNDGFGVAVPHDLESSGELGWSLVSSGQPLDVGSADSGFDTVVANIVAATEINADNITAGDLEMGTPGKAGTIRIFSEGGLPLGAWGNFGLITANPINSNRAIWRSPDGSLKFTGAYEWDGTSDVESGIDATTAANGWTTAIDWQGINAQAITFGAATGGNNRLKNAGFELQDYVGADVFYENVWTDTADWAAGLSQVNLRTDGGDLRMTKEP